MLLLIIVIVNWFTLVFYCWWHCYCWLLYYWPIDDIIDDVVDVGIIVIVIIGDLDIDSGIIIVIVVVVDCCWRPDRCDLLVCVLLIIIVEVNCWLIVVDYLVVTLTLWLVLLLLIVNCWCCWVGIDGDCYWWWTQLLVVMLLLLIVVV